MQTQTVTDTDGTTYTVTWAEDGRSAEVTTESGVLCIVYAARHDRRTLWYSTEVSDAYGSPMSAIAATTAARRAKPPPPEATVRLSWRDLMGKVAEHTVSIRPEQKPRIRKDFE